MKKKGLLKALCVCLVSACLMCGFSITAFAASAFSSGVNTSGGEAAAYASGATEAKINAAIDAKVAELNAAITGLPDGTALADAYSDGSILAYSIAPSSTDGTFNSDNKRSDFKVWGDAPVLDLRFLNAGYDGWSDNSVGWMCYDGEMDAAYIVSGAFAAKYGSISNEDRARKLGGAISDKVRVDTAATDEDASSLYVEYQNFYNGYMKNVVAADGTSTVTVVEGMFIDTSATPKVTEEPADVSIAGYIGALRADAGVNQEFRDNAYMAMSEAYMMSETEGFGMGVAMKPYAEYKFTGTGEKKVLVQEFLHGDSTSNPWTGTAFEGGRTNWAYIAYNEAKSEAFVLRDEIAFLYEKDTPAEVKQLGAPSTNVYKAKDDGTAAAEGETATKRRQDFQNGYILVNGAEPVVANNNFDVAANIKITVEVLEPFSATFNKTGEAGAYVGGRTEAQIVAALNAKIADLNTKIAAYGSQEVIYQGYKNGEIPAYSSIASNNGQFMANNKRSGFKLWDDIPVMDLTGLNEGFTGWGGNIGWLMYDGVKDKAYIVAGGFAETYGKLGGDDRKRKLGSAASDRFRVAASATSEPQGSQYVEYQNFVNGYIKCVMTSEGVAEYTVVPKMNIETDANGAAKLTEGKVTEIKADTASTGVIGLIRADYKAVSESEPDLTSEVYAKRVYDAFRAAYDALGDFDIGYTMKGIVDVFNSDWIYQQFLFGDSVARPWGDSRQGWAFMAYNRTLDKVFILRDEFMYIYDNKGSFESALSKLGAPVGNDFVVRGNRYQNFENGYIKVSGAAPSNENVHNRVTIIPDMFMYLSYDDAKTAGKVSAKQQTAIETVKSGLAGSVTELSCEVGSVILINITVNDENAAIVCGGGDAPEAYFIPADAYPAYLPTLGLPISDYRFITETGAETAISMMNFQNGYVLVKGGAAERIMGTFDADTNQYAVSAENIFTVNPRNMEGRGLDSVPAFHTAPAEADLIALLKKAYQDISFKGFKLGDVDGENITWWGDRNSINVMFGGNNSSGTSDIWGRKLILVYDFDNNSIHMITGALGDKYKDIKGWPVSDMMINPATGAIAQNFANKESADTAKQTFYLVANGTQVERFDGALDFEANGYVDWLNYSFAPKGIAAGTVVKEAVYELNAEALVDLKTGITNSAKYKAEELRFVLTSDKGTIENGVFKYTPVEKEVLTVTFTVYSPFETVEMSVELNMGFTLADKTALVAKYNALKEKNELNYTASSFEALQTALATAKTLVDGEYVYDQDAVDKALAALNTAEQGLVDISELITKYETYKRLEQGNYTETSFNALKAKLTAAKAVIDDPEATQAEVNTALNELNTAYEGLAEKKTDDKKPSTGGCGTIAPISGSGMGGGLAAIGLTLGAAGLLTVIARRKRTKA